jgi:hypothetical protein
LIVPSADTTMHLWRFPLAWTWTDDLARSLFVSGQLDSETASRITSAPVAIRVEDNSADREEEDDLPSAA